MSSATAFDFETFLIRPGELAPKPVCLTWGAEGGPPRGRHAQLEMQLCVIELRHMLKTRTAIGANTAYDMAVACEEWPELIPAVFQAYSDNRVRDVQLDQRLIDNAHGRLGGWVDHNGRKHNLFYSLAALELRHFKRDRSADKENPDAWRLRYSELAAVPYAEWPAEAREYAEADAVGALEVHLRQVKESAALLVDGPAQARAGFALHLMSCWGIMTDAVRVADFKLITEARFDELSGVLIEAGLVRPSGTRDTKKAKARMVEVCRAAGMEIRLTDTGLKCITDGKARTDLSGKTSKKHGPSKLTVEEEFPTLDADACAFSGDALLGDYADRTSLQTVVSSHVPALLKGTVTPLQARFNTMVESGRTSCSMGSKDGPTNGYQLQNVRRLPGIRECFRARTLFIDDDFPSLELHTFAQACITLVGASEMSKVLLAGRDVHLDMAAQILGTTYADADANRHDKEVKNARQLAKPVNFGFPGGLGPRGFVGFARGYGHTLKIEEAAALKEHWLARWPEAALYFRYIRDLCGEMGAAHVHQLFVGRQRGLVKYTAACNGFFQGLGSDGAKAALWEVARRCYDPTMESALFGVRPNNFVHDQIIAETTVGYDALPASRELREITSNEAQECGRVMLDACNRYLPDVPIAHLPAALSKYWSKSTEPLFDVDGLLVAHDLAREARAEVYDSKGEMVEWE